jgi:hypothetical protein
MSRLNGYSETRPSSLHAISKVDLKPHTICNAIQYNHSPFYNVTQSLAGLSVGAMISLHTDSVSGN